ncbi:hypothetical protein KI387_019579, partial [Taxus chinensis]
MAHLHALGTAVELADLAWDAYEFRHHQKEESYLNTDQQHQRCLELKGALDREHSENQRLRAALEEYEKIVQKIQDLSTQDPSAHMPPDSQSFPSDLYEQLTKTVESPAFLEKIQVLQQNLKMDEPVTMEMEGDILVNSDLDDASRWLWVTEDAALTKREEKSSLDGQNYIIVTEEDIVEGIALFMARIVAANPQSKNLSPEQLQSTISSTFANMKQTNIIHKLLSAGKVIYTVASWGLALYGLYTQRHIVKAATKAVVKS